MPNNFDMDRHFLEAQKGFMGLRPIRGFLQHRPTKGPLRNELRENVPSTTRLHAAFASNTPHHLTTTTLHAADSPVVNPTNTISLGLLFITTTTSIRDHFRHHQPVTNTTFTFRPLLPVTISLSLTRGSPFLRHTHHLHRLRGHHAHAFSSTQAFGHSISSTQLCGCSTTRDNPITADLLLLHRDRGSLSLSTNNTWHLSLSLALGFD